MTEPIWTPDGELWRPRWGRRGFLSLMGAAMAGTVLPGWLGGVSLGPASSWSATLPGPGLEGVHVGDVITIGGKFVPNTELLQQFVVTEVESANGFATISPGLPYEDTLAGGEIVNWTTLYRLT